MANRFMDSFDHYVDPNQKYTLTNNVQISAEAGRYGTAGMDMSASDAAYLWVEFPDFQNEWTVGLGYYRTAIPRGGDLISFQNGTSGSGREVGVVINPSGTMSIVSSGSILTTTAKTVQPNTWYYIEFQSSIGMANTATLHVNSVLWTSATGVTQTSGSAANCIYIGAAGQPYIDDLYINDATGTTNNTFWNNTRITYTHPATQGFYEDWTPTSGSTSLEIVSNYPPDADFYLSSGSPLDKSSFLMTAPDGLVGAAKSMQVSYLAKQGDITLRESRSFLRSVGGVDYPGATNTMTDEYVYYREIWETLPSSVTMDATNIALTQVGVEVIS